MQRLLTLVLVVAAVSTISGYSSQSLLLKLADRILLINEQAEGYKTVFTCKPYSYLRADTRLSSSGRHLSIMGLNGDVSPENCSDEGDTEIRLIIIDIEAGTKSYICNVQDYDWAPNEDKLVYILSNVDEEDREADSGDGFFSGEEVWLYDLESGFKKEILIGSHTMQGVGWSEYDGGIYILDSYGVQQYDLVADAIKGVPYPDVHISPNGKYCFRETVDDPCGLYLAASTKEIPFVQFDTGNEVNIYSDFVSWGMISGRTVLYLTSDGLTYIDCATGRMYKVIPPSPEIDPINDLVGFRDGRPVWAKIAGDKAELFYY